MSRLSIRLVLIAGSIAMLTATFAGGAATLSSVSRGSIASPYVSPRTPATGAQIAALKSVLGSNSSMGTPVMAASRAGQLATSLEAPIAATGGCGSAPDFNWLSTSGTWIVDDNGCKVRLEGVTWYGMQTINYVPAGLDFRTYIQIMQTIKDLGFNSIRIPLTDELVHDNMKIKIKKYIAKQPDFKGKHPLWILDKIVAEATKLHLFIILDNHTTYAIAKAKDTGVGDPVWTQGSYKQKDWINDWTTLATRYVNSPAVTGFDLRNEPHTHGPAPHGWTLSTYCNQGSQWGSAGACPHKKDWAAAVTKCANTILKINPNLLMFIEGVQLYPDSSQPGGVDSYWWGSILKGVAVDPIKLNVPNKLVYSPHEWGPWKYFSPQFWKGKVNYNSLKNVYLTNWAYILHSTDPAILAPIWLGEFNTCTLSTKLCVNAAHPKSPNHGQGFWFHNFVLFLHNNPEISWSYYPLNGTNAFDQPSNNSVLNHYWKKVKLPSIMDALKTIQAQPVQ